MPGEQRLGAGAGVELGSRYTARATPSSVSRRCCAAGSSRRVGAVEPAAGDARERRHLVLGQLGRARADRLAHRAAPTAAGTARAGSANGSSPAAGRGRSRAAGSPRTAAAPRDPSAARRRRPRSSCRRRRRGRRGATPRTAACAGRGGASRMSSMRIWSPSGSSTYRSGCVRRSTRAWSPSSSAAKRSARSRLPTPGGPCRRYACAGPSASAARAGASPRAAQRRLRTSRSRAPRRPRSRRRSRRRRAARRRRRGPTTRQSSAPRARGTPRATRRCARRQPRGCRPRASCSRARAFRATSRRASAPARRAGRRDGRRQLELAVLDLVEPSSTRSRSTPRSCAPGARAIRRDVAVADDEVALLDSAVEMPRRARGSGRRRRAAPPPRVHSSGRTELAVQMLADRAAERVVVVEREAEGRPRGGQLSRPSRRAVRPASPLPEPSMPSIARQHPIGA